MNNPASTPRTPAAPIRILSLGDSYTIGTGVTPDERFPSQLTEQLRRKGVEVDDAAIIAHNGWTTGELLRGIHSAGIEGPYDFVTLLIGVNNQFRGYDPEEYRQEFKELLEMAIEFAGDRPERAVVLSIPDWGAAPFAQGLDRKQISQYIDLFNRINRVETLSAGAQYIDITTLSRQIREDPSLAAEDGLHLSGKMYGMWAALALDKMLPVLQPEEGAEQQPSN